MAIHSDTDGATRERGGVGGLSLPGGRPRWLVPAVVGLVVVGALVITGVLELSTVLYAGAIGGMLVMHLGGHGHGAATTGDHAGHDTAAASDHSGHGAPREGAVARPASPESQPATPSRGCH